MKETIFIAFSGGQTSGYMVNYLQENMSHLYDFIYFYANTGLEHEKTLEFVNKCDKHFDMNLVWLEAVVSKKKGDVTKHKIVTYETASRDGEPMEAVIKKYGLPNMNYLHCNRETKLRPADSYKIELGLKDARTALGIRYDEFHRVKNRNDVIYPLATVGRVTKQMVNAFWEEQPFKLGLAEHDGNCKGCYKKSDKKLAITAKENPSYFDFWIRMEKENSNVLSSKEIKARKIYRGFRTAEEIVMQSLNEDIDNFDDVCAEECGSVINEFEPIDAERCLFGEYVS